MKPLEGLKVLDLTHVLAGPYATYQLGMLGADVIKVESPVGDFTRMWNECGSDEQLSQKLGTAFVAQNAGKRSLSVELHEPEAQEIVQQLARQADIFVQNFEPGSMAQYGLDYDAVKATSGFMSVNIRGDGPIRTGGPVLDYATGMHAASSIMSALLIKAKTDEGQYVDIGMQDVAMLLINRETSITASTGQATLPDDNRSPPLLGRFETSDGYAMLAGYMPVYCRDICSALGLSEYSALSDEEIWGRIAELQRQVEETLLTKTSAEWDDIFSEARVVAGGVRNLVEVFATGQPAARELLTDTHSALARHQVTGLSN